MSKILTPNQIELIKQISKKPLKEFTFNEIKNNYKSNSIIQNSIRIFLEKELILERLIGKNQKVYSLNYKNNLLNSYIETANNESLSKLVKKT